MLKWLALGFCLLQAMMPLTTILASLPPGGTAHFLTSLVCMINGIAFAFACVVLTLLSASYVYLSVVED